MGTRSTLESVNPCPPKVFLTNTLTQGGVSDPPPTPNSSTLNSIEVKFLLGSTKENSLELKKLHFVAYFTLSSVYFKMLSVLFSSFKGAGGLADLKISKFALLSLNQIGGD